MCTSAGWDDILVFLMVNYLAHAATSVKFPEETSWEVNKRRADALLAPYIGLMYALRKIQWCLVLETDPMRRACRAEALCQIVRTEEWRPIDGLTIDVPYLESKLKLPHSHSDRIYAKFKQSNASRNASSLFTRFRTNTSERAR